MLKQSCLTLLAAGALATSTATAQTNTTTNSTNTTNTTVDQRGTAPLRDPVQSASEPARDTRPVERSTNSDGTMTNDRMAANDGSMTAMDRGDASTNIGGMSRAEFDRMNMEGNRKVAAITPTSTPLSKQDQKLLAQMAEGGLMQLQMSQAAMPRLQRDDARVLAQSEVEEQTGVSAKLTEIARAKGMTLTTEPAAPTQEMLDRMEQTTAGADLDRLYTRQSGVKGHEKLMKTGEKVMREAQDPALKALAAATAPVIKMHMQVSQGVLNQMGNGNGVNANGTGRGNANSTGGGR